MASALTQQVCAHACPRKTVLSNPIKLLCIRAVFVHSPLSDFFLLLFKIVLFYVEVSTTHLDAFSCPPSVYLCEPKKLGSQDLAIFWKWCASALSLFPTPELTLDANPFPQGFLLSLPITSSSGLLFESLIHDRPASSSQKRFL